MDPDDVRAGRDAADRAPRGPTASLVGSNALPGGHLRAIAWDMLKHASRHSGDKLAKLAVRGAARYRRATRRRRRDADRRVASRGSQCASNSPPRSAPLSHSSSARRGIDRALASNALLAA